MTVKLLSPNRGIYLVDREGVRFVAVGEVSNENVGEKARGLASIPAAWTLPFFVVSCDVFECFDERPWGWSAGSEEWRNYIVSAMNLSGIGEGGILVRSSAVLEGQVHRGNLHTEFGMASSVLDVISRCARENSKGVPSRGIKQGIHLVVQRAVTASEKGHLSNEHRCSKEPRDWIGEKEKKNGVESFSIGLRNWRRKIDYESVQGSPIFCNLGVNISKSLEVAAAWASQYSARTHIEWVWDGKTVYIVQAEHEAVLGDFDPTLPREVAIDVGEITSMLCLKEISDRHAGKYNKIKNVFVYKELGLSTTRLFVLDDIDVLFSLSKGEVPRDLALDVSRLVRFSLVIRMDVCEGEKEARQMLPRTHEVRTYDEAIAWLIEKSAWAKANSIIGATAFIFHNFIPSRASAFAFAAPGERKVQIEALWGIPEGLYYNPHDKYIVDTHSSSIEAAKKKYGSYKVTEKINFKRHCVIPSSSGTWEMRTILESVGWRRTVPIDSEALQYMARASREIAEREGHGVSIMWFIDVPNFVSSSACIPWFHESFNRDENRVSDRYIKKTPLDEVFSVQTIEDMEALASHIRSGRNIRQIRILPKQEEMLRDKETLKNIGEIAKKAGAVIVMEGATLSHAYYQLQKTGAAIHVVYEFRDDEKEEFNKLVRDGVPLKIGMGGESATVTTLKGEFLLKALREKLVEEAIEVLDAKDHQAIIEEIADVHEVLDGLIRHLGATPEDVANVKQAKFQRVGGFEKGLVLLRTTNPLPMANRSDPNTIGLPFGDETDAPLVTEVSALGAYGSDVRKWTDHRYHGRVVENILKVSFPIVLNSWTTESAAIVLGANEVEAKAELSGARYGGEISVTLSIYALPEQLDMFGGD